MTYIPNNQNIPRSNANKTAVQVVQFPEPIKTLFGRFLQQSTGEDTVASSVNIDTIDAKTPIMKSVTGGYALGTAIVNSDGVQINDFGAPSTVCDYKSPGDFTATFATGTTITLTNLPPFLSTLGTSSNAITHVKVIPASGSAKVYINGSGGVTLKLTAGSTITITGAGATPFVAGDSYEVGINYKSSASLLSTKLEGLPPEYCSPWDGTVVYASSNTLTASGFPFTVDDANCYIRSIAWKTVGNVWNRISNGDNGVNIYSSAGTITVTGVGSPFTSTDIYRVAISAQKKSYDAGLDAEKVVMQNYPVQPILATIIETTNVANGTTTNYPSDDGIELGAYTGVCIQGIITAVTATVEATLVESPAAGDWFDITKAGLDIVNNVVGNASYTADFMLDYDNLNVRAIRVKYVTTNATNTDKLYIRRKV